MLKELNKSQKTLSEMSNNVLEEEDLTSLINSWKTVRESDIFNRAKKQVRWLSDLYPDFDLYVKESFNRISIDTNEISLINLSTIILKECILDESEKGLNLIELSKKESPIKTSPLSKQLNMLNNSFNEYLDSELLDPEPKRNRLNSANRNCLYTTNGSISQREPKFQEKLYTPRRGDSMSNRQGSIYQSESLTGTFKQKVQDQSISIFNRNTSVSSAQRRPPSLYQKIETKSKKFNREESYVDEPEVVDLEEQKVKALQELYKGPFGEKIKDLLSNKALSIDLTGGGKLKRTL